jgi:hypothetical protein
MRRTSHSESPRQRATLAARLESSLALPRGTFALKDPGVIARSLRAWAERRTPNPAVAFRSAMSLLVFYAARMARDLSKEHRARLEAAKVELRALYKDAPRAVTD